MNQSYGQLTRENNSKKNEAIENPWCPQGILNIDRYHIIDQLESCFNDLKSAQIFITGGTGFFGKWLLESIVAMNDLCGLDIQSTILTRNPEHFLNKMPHFCNRNDLVFVQGDVINFALHPQPFTHVIHAATAASVALSSENPLLMLDTVVQGTRRVLDFAVECGARQILFTSSGAVYGVQPTNISNITEECLVGPDVLDPTFCYHEAKRLAEMLCAIYAKKHNIEIKIARCFAFIGPHLPLDSHFAAGNFIRDALHGGPINVSGDGSSLRSYLYAADLVVWLWKILCKGVSLRPYNVGSPQAVSIAELARCVAQNSTPSGIEIRIAKKTNPLQPPARYVPDVSRACGELRLKVEIELEEAIRRTFTWLKCRQ